MTVPFTQSIIGACTWQISTDITTLLERTVSTMQFKLTLTDPDGEKLEGFLFEVGTRPTTKIGADALKMYKMSPQAAVSLAQDISDEIGRYLARTNREAL